MVNRSFENLRDDAELSRIDAAEFLGVSPATMATWVSLGRGPAFCRRGVGNKAHYLMGDLRRWLQSERESSRVDPEALHRASTGVSDE